MTVGAGSFGSGARSVIGPSDISVCCVNAAVKVSAIRLEDLPNLPGHAKLGDILKTLLLC